MQYEQGISAVRAELQRSGAWRGEWRHPRASEGNVRLVAGAAVALTLLGSVFRDDLVEPLGNRFPAIAYVAISDLVSRQQTAILPAFSK